LDLGRWHTLAVRPRPVAMAGGSSHSARLTAASFLDAWIWAWQAQIWVEDFLFLKNDFGCRSTITDIKNSLFFLSEKWYRLAQPIPITSYQSIQKIVFVVVSHAERYNQHHTIDNSRAASKLVVTHSCLTDMCPAIGLAMHLNLISVAQDLFSFACLLLKYK
jgi:hypothetical protein